MSTNCLVTKLKAECQNDNLRKIGELRMDFNVTEVNQTFGFLPSGLRIVCDHPFMNGSDRVEAGEEVFYVGPIKSLETGIHKFSTPNKYNLTRLSMLSDTAVDQIDASELEYSTGLIEISAYGQKMLKGQISKLPAAVRILTLGGTDNPVEGQVSDINKFTGLTKVEINSNSFKGSLSDITLTTLINVVFGRNVSGPISALANNLNLEAFYGSSQITGTAESYAIAAVAAGRTSGSAELHIPSGTRRVNFGSQYTGGYEVTQI
jgi:hypothetical protein